MKYLKLDGTGIASQKEAYLDFIKLNLLVPSGAAFCHSEYGYTDLDVSDRTSVGAAVNDILGKFDSHNISLDNVVKNSDSTMTVSFSGADDVITV